MSHRPSLLTTAFLIPAGLILPLSTSLAADVFWDNPDAGLFSDEANWDTDTVPTDADNAFIANGGTAQTQTDEFISVNTLRVQSGAVELSDAFVNTGLTSSTWQSPGDLQVGGIAGQTGSLTASGGSAIFTGRVRIGGWNDGSDQGNMHGSLTMSDESSLTTANGYDFWLGNGTGSTGTLDLSGGAQITVSNSMTSGRAGGDATVSLSGSSRLTVTSFAFIGESGTADWAVSEGASLEIGGNLTIAGGTTNSLTVQDSATVSVGGEFQIGNGGGSTGNVILTGGTVTANSWMSIGRQGGTGTLTMSGNAALIKTAGTTLLIGDGTTGTLTMSGNASIAADSNIRLGFGSGGIGTLTMSGGTVQTTGILAVGENGGQGTLNLNGGTITANSVSKLGGSGTLNFNGGTLRAGAASADFIAGFQAGDVLIQAGGVVIDTNTFDVAITLALTGDGGLTKIGGGALTLSGANTYLGDTSVTGGTLSITTGFLSDSANIALAADTVLNLDFVGADTVHALFLNGEAKAIGTWGALGSGAEHESAMFTGTGLLNVTAVPEPSTIALLALGLGAAGWGLRRRRR